MTRIKVNISKSFIIGISLIFLFIQIDAQDIHFSQFYQTPMLSNPANTGDINNRFRVSNIYRNQWSSLTEPYTTVSAGYDQPVSFLNQKLGLGGYIINDESSILGLSVLKLFLSGAYQYNFSGHILRAGIQIGFVNKSFSMDKLVFPNQFDMSTGHYNQNLNHGQDNLDPNLGYLDVNIGVSWHKKYKNLEPHFGFAIYHLNYSKETFLNQNNRIPLRPVMHGDISIDLSEKFMLKLICFTCDIKKRLILLQELTCTEN